MEPVGAGVVLASLLNGLRHGVDIDHIAAIGDIVSAQPLRRRSMLLACSYAIGHAAVVLLFGAIAIAIGARMPAAVDDVMGTFVGGSLIALGGYVLYSTVRNRGRAHLKSRWQLAGELIRKLRGERAGPVLIEHAHDHVHDGLHSHEHETVPITGGGTAVALKTHVHTHRHVAEMPSDPLPVYGLLTTFVIGIMHGVGAETPTQVALFAAAAGAGPFVLGAVVLGAFVAGMLLANTAIAVAFAWGSRAGGRATLFYNALAVATAVFSIAVGVSYLTA